jgi:hypothetical protein
LPLYTIKGSERPESVEPLHGYVAYAIAAGHPIIAEATQLPQLRKKKTMKWS